MAVAGEALPDHAAGQDVQCGEQRGRAAQAVAGWLDLGAGLVIFTITRPAS